MPGNSDFRAFMGRYFPAFLVGFFASLLSVALAVTLWVDSHWRSHQDNPLYTVVFCGGLVLMLCLGHFVMIRGLRWGMWVVLAVLAAPFLMVLSLIGSGLHAVLMALLVMLPLAALLVFNSGRHREMRQRLIELRKQRIS